MRQIEPVVPPVIIARDLNDVYTEVQRQAGISVDGGDYSQDAGGNSINIPPAQLQRFFRITGNTALPGAQAGPAYAWEEVQKTRTSWQALPVPHTGSLGKGNPLYEINGNDIPNGKVVKVWPDERGPGWDVSQTKRRFTWLCQYEPSEAADLAPAAPGAAGGSGCLRVLADLGCDENGNRVLGWVWLRNAVWTKAPCDYSTCITFENRFWAPVSCEINLTENTGVDSIIGYFSTFDSGPFSALFDLFNGGAFLLEGRLFKFDDSNGGLPLVDQPTVSNITFSDTFFFENYVGCQDWYSSFFETEILSFDGVLSERIDAGAGIWEPYSGRFSVSILKSRVGCSVVLGPDEPFLSMGFIFRIRFTGIPDLNVEISPDTLPPLIGAGPALRAVSDWIDPPLPATNRYSTWIRDSVEQATHVGQFVDPAEPSPTGLRAVATFTMGEVNCEQETRQPCETDPPPAE